MFLSNPVLDTLDVETNRQLIIAKIPSLTRLNRNTVSLFHFYFNRDTVNLFHLYFNRNTGSFLFVFHSPFLPAVFTVFAFCCSELSTH